MYCYAKQAVGRGPSCQEATWEKAGAGVVVGWSGTGGLQCLKSAAAFVLMLLGRLQSEYLIFKRREGNQRSECRFRYATCRLFFMRASFANCAIFSYSAF